MRGTKAAALVWLSCSAGSGTEAALARPTRSGPVVVLNGDFRGSQEIRAHYSTNCHHERVRESKYASASLRSKDKDVEG